MATLKGLTGGCNNEAIVQRVRRATFSTLVVLYNSGIYVTSVPGKLSTATTVNIEVQNPNAAKFRKYLDVSICIQKRYSALV